MTQQTPQGMHCPGASEEPGSRPVQKKPEPPKSPPPHTPSLAEDVGEGGYVRGGSFVTRPPAGDGSSPLDDNFEG